MSSALLVCFSRNYRRDAGRVKQTDKPLGLVREYINYRINKLKVSKERREILSETLRYNEQNNCDVSMQQNKFENELKIRIQKKQKYIDDQLAKLQDIQDDNAVLIYMEKKGLVRGLIEGLKVGVAAGVFTGTFMALMNHFSRRSMGLS